MKHPLKALLIASTLSLTSLSASAGAGSSGGGNTVNHQLIFHFAVKDTGQEIPDFHQVDKYLKMFSEKIPGCGKALHDLAYPNVNDAERVIWYRIPKEIAQLPEQTTGLRFTTEQPAMQQDREIFLSNPELASDKRKGAAERRGELYLNELLEMNHPQKDMESVRRIMLFLEQTDYNPSDRDLKNMMNRLGFSCGNEDTASEIAVRAAKDKHDADVRAEQGKLAPQIVDEVNSKVLSTYLASSQAVCKASLAHAQKLNKLQTTFNIMDFYYNVKKPDLARIPTLQGADDTDRGTVNAQGVWMMNLLEKGHFDSLMAALDFVLPEDESSKAVLEPSCDGCPDTTISNLSAVPSKNLTAFYKKYENYSAAQRVRQACDDISVLQGASGSSQSTVEDGDTHPFTGTSEEAK